MGNCLSITLFDFSCNSIPTCFQREGALDRNNLVDFKHDWELLKAARVDVTDKIEIEERQQMRRTEEVNHWLQRITEQEGPAETLIRDYTPEDAKRCFGGYCRKNYKKCYEFKSEMAPMVKEVKELLELKPNVVAQRILIAPAQLLPTEPNLCGVELTIDEAMRQIHDDEKVGIIGLSGMGGIGKTTILKEINNKLCNSNPKSFDLILWVVVSKSPNLKDIQNSIGEKIGLQHASEWMNKSQERKKLDIFNVLHKKKYIMLLDDIWDHFDLTKIGLPHPSATNKSKVIFTTRSQKVCGEMNAREIQVKCLTEEKSWDLFRANVGEATLNADRDIPELARVVMKECKNLPLALKVIGRAMTRETSPHCWKRAIKALKSNVAAHQFPQMGDEVFSILKYSYDSLPSDHMKSIKSCFLYCSLYPQDHILSKWEIIDKWICEGYLDGYNDLYEAREEGYAYISTLVNASLLEEDSPKWVKLHDVIRDMAIWIGRECGKTKDKFLFQTRCGLRQIPNDVNWDSVERMSFIGNGIGKLTEIPHCSKTLTMFLRSNNLMSISNSFFKSLPNIRVLDLSSNKKLRVLPDGICDLVNLQYLNLSYTGLKELPVDFKKLVALKYLNLTGTNVFSNIREGELRSCKKLQMLYSRVESSLEESNCVGTVLKDLDSLECLQELTLSLLDETSLSEFTSSVKLLSVTSVLELHHFDASRCLDFSFLERMERIDLLYMWQMKNLEKINVKSEVYFNNLRALRIYGCVKLEDLTWIVFAPNIEFIMVNSCHGMKRLVGGSLWDENINELERRIPFSKLKILILYSLPELESIYPTPLPFPCLSDLEVYVCEKLKKLPFNSNSCNGTQIKIDGGGSDWWNNLEWENEATRTKFSSTFKDNSKY